MAGLTTRPQLTERAIVVLPPVFGAAGRSRMVGPFSGLAGH